MEFESWSQTMIIPVSPYDCVCLFCVYVFLGAGQRAPVFWPLTCESGLAALGNLWDWSWKVETGSWSLPACVAPLEECLRRIHQNCPRQREPLFQNVTPDISKMLWVHFLLRFYFYLCVVCTTGVVVHWGQKEARRGCWVAGGSRAGITMGGECCGSWESNSGPSS